MAADQDSGTASDLMPGEVAEALDVSTAGQVGQGRYVHLVEHDALALHLAEVRGRGERVLHGRVPEAQVVDQHHDDRLGLRAGSRAVWGGDGGIGSERLLGPGPSPLVYSS